MAPVRTATAPIVGVTTEAVSAGALGGRMHPATQSGHLNAGPSERQLSRSTVSCRTIASSHDLSKSKLPVASCDVRPWILRSWFGVEAGGGCDMHPRSAPPVLLAVGGHRPTLPSPAHPAPAPWPAPALRHASAAPAARAAPPRRRSKIILTPGRPQSAPRTSRSPARPRV